MTRTTKITEKLHWTSLKETFPIGMRNCEELQRDAEGKIVLKDGNPVVVKISKFVNELEVAAKDGTLDNMVVEAANLYHDGDIQGVLTAMARDMDSKRCNLKKMYVCATKHIDEVRLATMDEYIKSRRTAKTRTTDGLPQWAYGTTQIDAIDDTATLQKVINSINDVCCGKAAGSYVKHLGEDYLAVAKANREYARKRKAILEAKANAPDPELLAKLSKGNGKVTFTAAQAAELLKLIGR